MKIKASQSERPGESPASLRVSRDSGAAFGIPDSRTWPPSLHRCPRPQTERLFNRRNLGGPGLIPIIAVQTRVTLPGTRNALSAIDSRRASRP